MTHCEIRFPSYPASFTTTPFATEELERLVADLLNTNEEKGRAEKRDRLLLSLGLAGDEYVSAALEDTLARFPPTAGPYDVHLGPITPSYNQEVRVRSTKGRDFPPAAPFAVCSILTPSHAL